jgi:hypothetical protein
LFENIKLTGERSNGSIINTEGDVVIDNCTFINTSSFENGGIFGLNIDLFILFIFEGVFISADLANQPRLIVLFLLIITVEKEVVHSMLLPT